MIELTLEQRKGLSDPEPLMIDPTTKETYVLVRKELYDRIRSLLDDSMPNPVEVGRLIESAMSEDDANDPLLESYQRYLDTP